ncbi:MAG: PIN domain-containing protein [Pyrinomonadaceae bacterium]
MAKVYLDVCCLNRPFDDQTHDRIHLEAEAVLLILTHVERGRWQWIGSETLDYEIERTPDSERRLRVRLLATAVDHRVLIEAAEEARARELEALGFHALDALHLSCAESGGAEALLTTDDRLLRLAVRFSAQLRIRVANPLTWLQEQTTA